MLLNSIKLNSFSISSVLMLCGTISMITPVYAKDTLIEGAAITQTVSCDHDNLTINGASNTITATGHCNQIEINGASVKVTADSVSRIKITGASSTVLYKQSPNKNGKAAVSIIGAGSSAKKM